MGCLLLATYATALAALPLVQSYTVHWPYCNEFPGIFTGKCSISPISLPAKTNSPQFAVLIAWMLVTLRRSREMLLNGLNYNLAKAEEFN